MKTRTPRRGGLGVACQSNWSERPMTILHSNAPGRKDPNNLILPAVGDATPMSGKPLPESWSRITPGEEATTPQCVYEASLRLVAAGLSVIPIDAYEGSKSPDSLRLPHPHERMTGKPRPSWSVFKIRRPNTDELRRWQEMDGP